jgi:hypothetical protein
MRQYSKREVKEHNKKLAKARLRLREKGCYECTDTNKMKAHADVCPYILSEFNCVECGALYPNWFIVTNEEWKRNIPLHKQESLICRECYDKIKRLV